jgi:signal transduction histidine kinase
LKNKSKKAKNLKPKKENRIDRFFRSMDHMIRTKISSNIQLELIFAVAFCLVVAFLAYNVTFNLSRKVKERQYISYDQGISDISSSANEIAERMLNDLRYKKEETITDEMRETVRYPSENNPEAKQFNLSTAMNNLITDFSRTRSLKVMVSQLNGEIIYKTNNVVDLSIDIFAMMKSAYDIDYNNPYFENQESVNELTFVYPMNFLEQDIYLIIKDTPIAEIETQTTYSYNSSLALLVGLLFFISGFLILTKTKMDYIQELYNTVKIMTTGNLKYKAPVKGHDELSHLAQSINVMAKEINQRMEEERKLEKAKQELITNVSHDLRTPLTSIIGYLGLAKSENLSNEKKNDYIQIAYSKSESLKVLISELFEYTKLQSPENKPVLSLVNLGDLLDQLVEEMIPMAEDKGLEIIKSFAERSIFISVEPQQIVRVFENLISNAIKYTYGNQPIEVSLEEVDVEGFTTIMVKNAIQDISDEDTAKMFERFYRLEKSRSSETGGTGLGLAIAESIVHSHEGEIFAKKQGENTLVIVVKLPGKNRV